MEAITFNLTAVVLSEVIAVWLIWRLWRSGQHIFFKISLSLLAVIPILGPLLVLWLADFPPRVHPALRDKYRYSTDVFDSWHHVHKEPNPERRLEKWISTLKNYRRDDA